MRGGRYVAALFLIVLVGLLSIGYRYDMNTFPVPKRMTIPIESPSHVADFYIDPVLFRIKAPVKNFLIISESFEAQWLLERKLLLNGYKILYRYKLIPALFVEGNLDLLLRKGGDLVGIRGIYANRIYLKPRYLRGLVREALPTTNDTAYLVGANVFWEHGYRGENVVVAVIDTGIDKNHPELEGKVIAEKSFVRKYFGYGVDDPSTRDDIGHGTACSGIIAGRGIDPRGQGMAPEALLMNAKIFTRLESGAPIAAIIAAIEWAAYGPDGEPNTGDEADVINMSLGGGEIYNSPLWLAVKRATELGVVVSISAGNEGENQIASMSIGDPGNSPWAITVGATDPCYMGLDELVGLGGQVVEYTSIGPTILFAVKPDVVAPSGTVVVASGGGYTADTWHGTSFSAPHVSGCAALLINYLRNHSVEKLDMPWLVKTILVSTAIPLYGTYGSERVRFEDLAVGAGAISMVNAFNLLESSAINGDNYPQWIYILPTKIPVGISNATAKKYSLHRPYFPYFDKVFNGQTIFLNITIMASRPTNMSISFSGNFTNALDIHSALSITIDEPTEYWELNFTVLENASEGYYCGEIVFSDDQYGIEKRTPISFIVKKPKVRALLDLKHTDWSIDIRYGQYRLLIGNWEKLGVSIDMLPFKSKKSLSSELLQNYDLLFMPDTVSATPIFDEIGRYVGYEFQSTKISWEEILAIYKFIGDGGSVLVFALSGIGHNLTNINELLSPTGAYLYNKSWLGLDTTVAVSTKGDHIIIKGIQELPYQGIQVNKSFLSDAFLGYEDYDLAIVHQGFEGGAIIALGSNFMFDNWAFCGEYPGSTDVPKFARNIIEMVANWSRILNNTIIANAEYISYGSSIIFINQSVASLDINIKNSTALINLTWEILTENQRISGEFTYDDISQIWTTTIDISAITSARFMLRIEAYIEVDGKIYSVARAGTIIRDSSSPTITLHPSQVVVPKNGSVSTNIILLDDTAINISSLTFSLNISEYETKLVMVDIFSYKLEMVIPSTLVEQMYANGKKTFYVSIDISVNDILGKTASEEKILTIIIDDESPTITISAPTAGEFLRGKIKVSVKASDALSGVSSVSLYLDKAHIQTVEASQYIFSLDTTKYVDGEHTIGIKAKDRVGNIAWKNITVYFDNTAPQISIVGINNGSKLSGTIVFNISTSDNLSGPKNITVYLDSEVLATTSEQFLTVQLDTTKYSNGEYLISVVAYDNAGNQKMTVIQVTISNAYPIPWPVISIAIVVIIAVVAVFYVLKIRKTKAP